MSKLEINNYRCKKEEFESMSLLEKRNYIIQQNQEETNWWLLRMAKIYVIGFGVAIAIGLMFAIIAILVNIR